MSAPTASTSPSSRDQRHAALDAVVRFESRAALHGSLDLDRCGGALRPVSLRRYRLERARAAWRDFFREVRAAYPAQPGKYARFLAIMTRYAAGERMAPENGIAAIMLQVAGLFHDRPRLVESFNRFLPHGYAIHLTSDPLVFGLEEWVEAPGGGYSLRYFSWQGPSEYGHGGWIQE